MKRPMFRQLFAKLLSEVEYDIGGRSLPSSDHHSTVAIHVDINQIWDFCFLGLKPPHDTYYAKEILKFSFCYCEKIFIELFIGGSEATLWKKPSFFQKGPNIQFGIMLLFD